MDSCLKWHGGKQSLAPFIISKMVKHVHYVEPYFGAGHVLFCKPFQNVSEVANDINGNLMNFWEVLRTKPAEFMTAAALTPVSEEHYQKCERYLATANDNKLSRALCFFTVCRQSMSGRMDTFHPYSKRQTRRGMNQQVAEYLSAVDRLPDVAERIQRIALYNRPALEVIDKEDSECTQFYLDPPYMAGTRTAPDVYAHEMKDDEHLALLRRVKQCKGAVLLSGYRSEMYDTELATWKRWDIQQRNLAGVGMRIESLWSNRGIIA